MASITESSFNELTIDFPKIKEELIDKYVNDPFDTDRDYFV